MNTLKQFQEEVKKKFEERWSYASFTWNENNTTGVKMAKQVRKNIKDFLSQQTTLAYELGKKEMLEMVVKGIDGMEIKDYKNNVDWGLTDKEKGYNQAFDSLKQKLLALNEE